MSKKKKKIAPLPAVASEDGPFIVEEHKHFWSQSLKSKNKAGKFRAPLDIGDEELALRVHQYGRLHLKSCGAISEELLIFQSNTLHNSWVQVALDAITDSYLLSRGCEEIKKTPIMQTGSAEPLTSAAYSIIRYAALRDISAADKKNLSGEQLQLLKDAIAKLKKWGAEGKIPEKEFIKTLTELQAMFGFIDKSLLEDDAEYYKTEDEMSLDELMQLLLGEDDPKDDASPANMDLLEKAIKKRLREAARWSPNAQNRWGKMTVETLKLSKENKHLKKARKTKPHYIGAFKYPHRALLPGGDGMAFGLRQRVKGGTILLDCSGSMRIEQEDIDQLLRIIPMATIACYQGQTQSTGILAIIVKHGKVATSETIQAWREKMNRGNIVDGPALTWLSKQAEPRIWISDGQVTGVHDASAPNLNVEAALIKAKGKIKRFNSIEDYLKSLNT